MTRPPDPPEASQPVLGDDPAPLVPRIPKGSHNDIGEPDSPEDFGRIGYGRFGRYTPFGLAIALIVVMLVIGVVQHRDSGSDGDATAPPPGTPQVGQAAPDFTLTALDGQQVTLSSLRGSVVFVNFWASWCDYCRDEIPHLEAIDGTTTANGTPVRVIGVGVLADKDGPARDMIGQLGVTYPVGRDTGHTGTPAGPIQTQLGVVDWAMPSTVIVAPDGTIAAVHYGPMDADAIRKLANDAATPASASGTMRLSGRVADAERRLGAGSRQRVRPDYFG